MRSLLIGILAIIIIGIGGFVYRNAVEHPSQQITCPLDIQLCPDDSAVKRTGNSCIFPECPPPNITLATVAIAFALPDGFNAITSADPAVAAQYTSPAGASSTGAADISIRQYPISASSTALATIQKTAIGGASGAPVPTTSFTSTVIGNHRFTVVSIERFEGVIVTAYYLARGSDVLRFDAIDRGVTNWTSQNLDVFTLPAHAALRSLLETLQGE